MATARISEGGEEGERGKREKGEKSEGSEAWRAEKSRSIVEPVSGREGVPGCRGRVRECEERRMRWSGLKVL